MRTAIWTRADAVTISWSGAIGAGGNITSTPATDYHDHELANAMILGIDNGLDGGIVLLSDCRGPVPIALLKMPTVKVKKGSAAREIDRLALFDIFRQIVAPEGLVVCIEECPRHARSKAAMRSMAMSYGTILGVLASFQARLNWRVIQVASGNALAGWQRQMLGTMPQGKTKAAALAAAQSIWPGVQWKHDGIVDAALIAEWGRRKNQLETL